MCERDGWIEKEKHMDTVATNSERSLTVFVCNKEKVFVILHVSNHLTTQPTHQPARSISISVSIPDPTYIVKPETQMATLSFKRVFSGYTVPNHSF